MALAPQEISAADFKAKCLKLMDWVESERTEVVITKRGRPIAKLVAYSEELPSIFGFMSGSIQITGDILSPLDIVWDAELDA